MRLVSKVVDEGKLSLTLIVNGEDITEVGLFKSSDGTFASVSGAETAGENEELLTLICEVDEEEYLNLFRVVGYSSSGSIYCTVEFYISPTNNILHISSGLQMMQNEAKVQFMDINLELYRQATSKEWYDKGYKKGFGEGYVVNMVVSQGL